MFDIQIRDIKITDLEDYLKWMAPDRHHHNFNGPYFKRTTLEELKAFVAKLREKFENGENTSLGNRKMIVRGDTDELLGMVNWYWKSEETLWLEVGLVVFNENYWGQNIGYKALNLWIDEIFAQHPEIVRIGLTTWSGNLRMMKLAEKLHLEKEATYRKARIVNGEYFDSVSYGILREEWEGMRHEA